MIPTSRLKQILSGFSKKKIAAVGDFIADEYIYGNTSRVSREAPVLILKFDQRDVFPGGCGNACFNLHALGSRAIPFGVIGKDTPGKRLLKLLESNEINTDGMIEDLSRMTTRKARILAGSHHTTKQQVIRIDYETEKDINPGVEKKLIRSLEMIIPNIDALLVSDYGLGTITDGVREFINSAAAKKKIIVTVDSRFSLHKFTNVTALTPNESEASEASGTEIGDDTKSLLESGAKLMEKTDADSLLITRGRKGMSLFKKDGSVFDIPVYGTDEIADVTGAGDTVISTFTLALACNASFEEAMLLADLAGGIVVMKRGTATVSADELIEAVDDTDRRPVIRCLKKK
ncbi:MAG: hypothetical protein HZA77_07285 [Candidatus Schekmanbacteria bacterium]|nr:hypothetical protein [Candidatus Schekmanbacteria bacterium]